MPSLLCNVKLFWAANAAIAKYLMDDQPNGEGEMFSMFSRVASLAPTLSPILISSASLRILMGPLEILMMTPKAWKKEVYSGPRSMFWADRMT